jgi:hypothetical protein
MPKIITAAIRAHLDEETTRLAAICKFPIQPPELGRDQSVSAARRVMFRDTWLRISESRHEPDGGEPHAGTS